MKKIKTIKNHDQDKLVMEVEKMLSEGYTLVSIVPYVDINYTTWYFATLLYNGN